MKENYQIYLPDQFRLSDQILVEILNFLIRKLEPCFSWICQKVEDWLWLFSRQYTTILSYCVYSVYLVLIVCGFDARCTCGVWNGSSVGVAVVHTGVFLYTRGNIHLTPPPKSHLNYHLWTLEFRASFLDLTPRHEQKSKTVSTEGSLLNCRHLRKFASQLPLEICLSIPASERQLRVTCASQECVWGLRGVLYSSKCMARVRHKYVTCASNNTRLTIIVNEVQQL